MQLPKLLVFMNIYLENIQIMFLVVVESLIYRSNNVYYKYFQYMLEKFNQNKILLKSEKYGCYDDLITIIHIFIFYLYDDCYYDETKKKICRIYHKTIDTSCKFIN